MAASLVEVNARFSNRVTRLSTAFTSFEIVRGGRNIYERWAAQEGFLSSLWQAWCSFCRETIILSCRGTTTQAGINTTCPFSHHTEAEILFIAKCLANNSMPNHIRAIPGMYAEPTWGDVTKIPKILLGLAPSNVNTMATAFSAITLAVDLQIVRNTCSHLNRENISSINAIKVKYDNNKFKHPSDAMFWIDPVTHNFAWQSWILEFRVAANEAIK
ncbi:hypothetical protein [Mesorhizobium sp. M0207]|uniref:hypothetical protein n=1 Tax=Mesorhizobium sp. M0207 TaxID=2956915 RepID=UPI00333CCCCF